MDLTKLLNATEYAHFAHWVSFGDFRGLDSHPVSSDRTLAYRAKNRLGLRNRNSTECLAWVMVNCPYVIIEDSPIGRALGQILKYAKLGKQVYEEVSEVSL